MSRMKGRWHDGRGMPAPKAAREQIVDTDDVRACAVNWIEERTGIPIPELEAQFDQWLRGMQAAAWAEGHHAGWEEVDQEWAEDGHVGTGTYDPDTARQANPYTD